jgi:hypothetical protein
VDSWNPESRRDMSAHGKRSFNFCPGRWSLIIREFLGSSACEMSVPTSDLIIFSNQHIQIIGTSNKSSTEVSSVSSTKIGSFCVAPETSRGGTCD